MDSIHSGRLDYTVLEMEWMPGAVSHSRARALPEVNFGSFAEAVEADAMLGVMLGVTRLDTRVAVKVPIL